MSGGYWAERADQVLAEVFAALPKDASERQVKAALREAYPFGPRAHWPYKAWLCRCRAWRGAHRLGMRAPATARAQQGRRDGASGDLFSTFGSVE